MLKVSGRWLSDLGLLLLHLQLDGFTVDNVHKVLTYFVVFEDLNEVFESYLQVFLGSAALSISFRV